MLITEVFIWHMQGKSRRIDRLCSQKYLGFLVVVFIPKRTRFELLFICCGDHFRKQMYSICMFFLRLLLRRAPKNVSSVAVLTHGPCGFRPFDFYSKLKIENQKFTIEISICLIPQELKITNLQS